MLYAPDGTEIGMLIDEAVTKLGCSRALVYRISEPVEGGRKLTRWPMPSSKRGPDKKPRKRRPRWEPTL